MKMHDEEGPERTSAFATRSLSNYILLAAPVIAGVASVGPEMLSSLASDRYAAAAGVFPWVIAGMVVDGAASIVGAGLFIHRKTPQIMLAVVVAAVINLLCNFVLVRQFGMVGAAASTLIGYAVVYVAFAWGARRYLPVPVPWATLLRAGFAAGVMYVALSFILPGHRFITVGVRGLAGLIIYCAVIAAIDANGCMFVKRGLQRVRAKLGR